MITCYRTSFISFIYLYLCFISCVWVFCLHAYLCTTCMPGNMLGLLHVELQRVMSWYTSPRNRRQVLGKSSQFTSTIFSTLNLFHFSEHINILNFSILTHDNRYWYIQLMQIKTFFLALSRFRNTWLSQDQLFKELSWSTWWCWGWAASLMFQDSLCYSLFF